MGINFWGVAHGVKYFLPMLKMEPGAHSVNFSSVFGIVAPAGQSAYSASKFAVRGFTEALRHELEGTSGFVSCVHPGGIRTPIARRARLGANTPPGSRDEAVARVRRLAPARPGSGAGRILQGAGTRQTPIWIVRGVVARLEGIRRLLNRVPAERVEKPSATGRRFRRRGLGGGSCSRPLHNAAPAAWVLFGPLYDRFSRMLDDRWETAASFRRKLPPIRLRFWRDADTRRCGGR